MKQSLETDAPTNASPAAPKITIKDWINTAGFGGTEVVLAGALVALFLASGLVRPAALSFQNLQNVAQAAIPLMILAVGELMVVITAGIDLSVGSVFSLSQMITASLIMQGQPVPVGILGGLATGLIFGLFNGFCVAHLRLAPFVVTLVSLSVAASLAFIVTDGHSIPVRDAAIRDLYYGTSLGLPNKFLIPILVVVAAQLVLSFSVFGRWIFAVGSNPEAAVLVGIPKKTVLIVAYAVSGLCAALASMLQVSYLYNAEVTSGRGLELSAIAAVVIGGASLFGGRGSAIGALIGALIITAIQNTVNLLGINTFWQGTVTGVVILIAVLFDRISLALTALRREK
jgi:ribose transport system permease protein